MAKFDDVHLLMKQFDPIAPGHGMSQSPAVSTSMARAAEPLNPALGSCIFVLMAQHWRRQLSWKKLLCPLLLVASRQPHQKP